MRMMSLRRPQTAKKCCLTVATASAAAATASAAEKTASAVLSWMLLASAEQALQLAVATGPTLESQAEAIGQAEAVAVAVAVEVVVAAAVAAEAAVARQADAAAQRPPARAPQRQGHYHCKRMRFKT